MVKLNFLQPRLYAVKISFFSAVVISSLLFNTGTANAVCLADDPVNKNPIKPVIQKDATAKFRLVQVASGLVAPNWGIAAPGDTDHLFVTDTVGQLWAVNINTQTKVLVLNVAKRLVPLGLFGIGYDERGLLGVAFHPQYQQNGLFYTYTSEPVRKTEKTDFPLHGFPDVPVPDSRSVITEWKMLDPAAAQLQADVTSRRVVMRIDQPQFNHNGGALNFGKDGMLYIALGDGGNAEDEGDGHNPDIGNGQDRSTVLGKILRINPLLRSAPNGQYGIPATNPFTTATSAGGTAGCSDGICDEIWAYGFRNPYRFSFDSGSGALVVGDVGQYSVEEVDVVEKGGNYGWHFKEGRFFFQPNGANSGFISDTNCLGVDTTGLLDPIAQYDHLRSGATAEGIAIVGGFVYRGEAVPELKTTYVFGDYSQQFAQPLGRLFYINGKSLRSAAPNSRVIRELRIQNSENLGLAMFGFGQDAAGELYVLGNTTGVPSLTAAGKTGVVMKLVPTIP
jgi:glucose/arabinose dehydrogenase